MRRQSDAITAAVRMIAGQAPARPEQDPKLLLLKQLHAINRDSLIAAQNAEFAATRARLAALSAFEETRVRIEILEEELGIFRDEEEAGDL